ncbi:MAG: hypothetical protein U1F43_31015 [Myxococcota bacterium]
MTPPSRGIDEGRTEPRRRGHAWRDARLALALLALAGSTPACGKKEPAPSEPTKPTAAATPSGPSGAPSEADAGATSAPSAAGAEAAAPSAADAAVAVEADAGEPAPPAVTVIGRTKEEPPEHERVYCDGPLDGRTPEHYVVTDKGMVGAHLRGPEGTVVKVQGKQVTLGKDGADIDLDVIAPMLGNGRGSYSGLIDDHVSYALSWTLPDGKVGGGALTCSVMDALSKALMAIRKGPMPWPGEGEQRYKKDAMVVAASGGVVSLEGDGDAKLYNVDFIAIERDVSRNLSACRYDVVDTASGKRTGEIVSKERYAIDLYVDVYDRRSGRKIKSRSVSAPTPECPDQIPIDAVSAGGERADLGTFYDDLMTPRGDELELGMPLPELKIDAATAGAQIAESKLPTVATVDQRFMASAGCKVDPTSKPTREDETDHSHTFAHTCMLADDSHFVSVEAHDWAPAKRTVGDEEPTGYLVGGRTAIKVGCPAADIATLLQQLAPLTFEKPDLLEKAVVAAGYALSGDAGTADADPGIHHWVLSANKGASSCLIEAFDWSEVADGKAPNAAVARSKDGFVALSGDDATLVKDLLAKLVK